MKITGLAFGISPRLAFIRALEQRKSEYLWDNREETNRLRNGTVFDSVSDAAALDAVSSSVMSVTSIRGFPD